MNVKITKMNGVIMDPDSLQPHLQLTISLPLSVTEMASSEESAMQVFTAIRNAWEDFRAQSNN